MGILSEFHKKVIGSFNKDEQEKYETPQTDNLIALGVLLWIVAQADDKFLSHESEKIEEILREHSKINEDDMPIVLRAIEEADIMRIDMYSFVQDASEGFDREAKVNIIENLFRVACVDNDLDNEELEMIRKISGLLRLDHQEFIDTKVKIKKEHGMDTTGL